MRVDRTTLEPESAFYGGPHEPLGDYGHLRKLTTNQKVAGSSPAECAPESPANRKILADSEFPTRSGPVDLTATEDYLSRLLDQAKAILANR